MHEFSAPDSRVSPTCVARGDGTPTQVGSAFVNHGSCNPSPCLDIEEAAVPFSRFCFGESVSEMEQVRHLSMLGGKR